MQVLFFLRCPKPISLVYNLLTASLELLLRTSKVISPIMPKVKKAPGICHAIAYDPRMIDDVTEIGVPRVAQPRIDCDHQSEPVPALPAISPMMA